MVDPSLGVALFLSVHLDDAVFSCGGTLAALQRTGWRIIVATVCTEAVEYGESGMADYFNLAGAATLGEGLARRRGEDRRAGDILGFVPLHLGLFDASFRPGFRGPGATPDMFIDPLIVDPYQTDIGSALSGCIGVLAPDLILAPLAVGDHVDHVLVRNAFAAYASASAHEATSIVWYQDLPYGFVDGGQAAAPLPGLTSAISTFTAPDLERKLDAAGQYRSQLPYFPVDDWRRALSIHAASLVPDGFGEQMWFGARPSALNLL